MNINRLHCKAIWRILNVLPATLLVKSLWPDLVQSKQSCQCLKQLLYSWKRSRAIVLGASPLRVLVPGTDYVWVQELQLLQLSDETGDAILQENHCGGPWRSPGSSVQRCQGQASAHAETVAEVLLRESCHVKPYCSRLSGHLCGFFRTFYTVGDAPPFRHMYLDIYTYKSVHI